MGFTQLPGELFRFAEFEGHIDHQAIRKVIEHASPGCIFRAVIPADVCTAVAANFLHLTGGSARADGVPGQQIGPFHYKKSTTEYFAEVDSTADAVGRLFEGINNPMEAILQSISTALGGSGYQFRQALFQGREAGRYIARCWTDTGPYSLLPHEDMAQLESGLQADFEIQKVSRFNVVGANLCLRKQCGGADLRVWNMIPDREMRQEFGLEATGYPYPDSILKDCPSVVVEIGAGDLYLLNAGCIHAVTEQTSPGIRLTLSFLMGRIDASTVVAWT